MSGDRDQLSLVILGVKGPAFSRSGIEGKELSLACQTPPPTHCLGCLRGACAGARREPRIWPSPHQIRPPPGRWQPSEPARSLRKPVVDGKTNAPAGAFWPAPEPRGPRRLLTPERLRPDSSPGGSVETLGVPFAGRPALRGPHPQAQATLQMSPACRRCLINACS